MTDSQGKIPGKEIAVAFLAAGLVVLAHQLQPGGFDLATGAVARVPAALPQVLITVACGLVIWTTLSRASAPAAIGFSAPTGKTKAIVSVAVLATGLYLVALLPLDRERFVSLSAEDGLIESGTALFLFGGAFVFLMATRRLKLAGRMLGPLLAALAAAGLFFLGGEEVSWFQRQLGLATPETFFWRNQQHELNLHNMATDFLNDAYYLMAFVFLVFGPILASALPSRWVIASVRPFLPGTVLIVAGAIAAAFNPWLVGRTLEQISFFGTLLVLTMLSVAYPSTLSIPRWLFLSTAAAVLIIQLLLLTSHGVSASGHEPHEYKEFFIAIGLFLYSLDVWSKSRAGYCHSSRTAKIAADSSSAS